MTKVIGFAGYCGVGKTAAVDFCENLGFGRRVYVGKFVLDEILKTNLLRTPESEERIRLELRDKYGPGFLAGMARPLIQGILEAGQNVLIDAVASLDEAQEYQKSFDGYFELIAVSSSFDIRAARLASRGARSMSAAQIRERDELERTSVRTDLLLESAKTTIENNSTIDDFHMSLRQMVSF
ncbi:hypothetical protein H8A99_22705 [Bradyrhizobium sp. Arg68]|uniref:hypothetical protein n=1 Tax=Bradyrhizobium ivorense TaxID=2511166 RepID=UPI001E3B20A2|nr:hypothetical protein [Bradyrhizobium ivorense]MCC8939208.1 hypothetical protein [Bradyrhizobium ivorense]